jgi:hypothetical protein
MGSLFGGGTTTSSSTSSSAPWGPQGAALTTAFNDAGNTLNKNLGAGPYPGNFVAGSNPTLASAITAGGNYASGLFPGLASGAQSAGTTLMGGAPTYLGNAENIASNGIAGPNSGLMSSLNGYGTGQTAATGPNAALSSALNSAAVSGANSLNGFTGTLQAAANQGLANPTQQIEANAQTYANSPQTQAELAATNNAINQTLNEQTLPGLNRGAAAEGDLNSSRAAMGQGMAQQAAATAEGQADANIENNAYNTGMGTAAGLYSSGLNTATNAATLGYNANASNANTNAALQQGLGEFNAGNTVNAATAGLNSGLNYELGNANTQLNANTQIGNGVGLGYEGAQSAGNAATTGFNLGAGAGELQQQQDQNSLTNALDQWQMSTNFPWSQLDNYMGVVGSNNWGGTTNTTGETTAPTNIAGGIAGLGLLAGMPLTGGATGLFGPSSLGGSLYNGVSGLFGNNSAAGAQGGNYVL